VTPQDEKLTVTDGYVLQVGAFRERGRAESLSKQMVENGFKAFIEETPLNQAETAYRVRVGPYTELGRAQESAQELSHRSGYQVLIVPLPSNDEKGEPQTPSSPRS
jgi:cell division protein FtsN